MKKIFLILFPLLLVTCYLLPAEAADTPLTDWVIRDFQSEIVVNQDSSLDITERITADCGDLPDKHGIFRVLPLQTKTDKGTIKTPVILENITDFSGNVINFEETISPSDHTITWKIGDADRTVTGENDYQIKYKVKNAVRGQTNFDELYWNLSGNFWQIDIENFSGKIIFPDSIKESNANVWLYSGSTGETTNRYSESQWTKDNILEVNSTQFLSPGQGITVSITFPKNIIAAYVPTFWDKYGAFFWFIVPLLTFIWTFSMWKKYGDDPSMDKAVTPEFDPPQKLSPIKMGALFSNGRFSPNLIAATIINLAVKKAVKIEEIEKSLLTGKNFRFTLLDPNVAGIDKHEKSYLEEMFPSLAKGDTKTLLEIKKDPSFYNKIQDVEKGVKNNLFSENLMVKAGSTWAGIFLGFGIVLSIIIGIGSTMTGSYHMDASLMIATLLFFIFAAIMPKRTQTGADIYWQICGFNLFIKTAEKYRAQFNEKENIFETYLPYAIMFGLTKEWIKAVEQIKGPEFFTGYHPYWYVGDFGHFDVNSFNSAINSVSSSVGSSMGDSSGAGGGGRAGGGGGGGGGGGW